MGEIKIINKGTDDVNQMAALGCCWPPGTETMVRPNEEEAK